MHRFTNQQAPRSRFGARGGRGGRGGFNDWRDKPLRVRVSSVDIRTEWVPLDGQNGREDFTMSLQQMEKVREVCVCVFLCMFVHSRSHMRLLSDPLRVISSVSHRWVEWSRYCTMLLLQTEKVGVCVRVRTGICALQVCKFVRTVS